MVAVGFPPRVTDSVRYKRPREELLDAIETALDDLGWRYHYEGKATLRVSFGMSMTLLVMSWGEKMTIEVLKDGTIDVQSESSFPLAWIDWGKNEQNVSQFLNQLDDVLNPRPRRRRDRDPEESDDEPPPRSKRRRVSDD